MMKNKFNLIYESALEEVQLVADYNNKIYNASTPAEKEKLQAEFKSKLEKFKSDEKTKIEANEKKYAAELADFKFIIDNYKKALEPWVNEPYEGAKYLKYPSSNETDLKTIYYNVLQRLSQLTRLQSNLHGNFAVDIPPGTYFKVVKALRENPYLQLTELYTKLMESAKLGRVFRNDLNELIKYLNVVDVKPKWIDLTEIQELVEKNENQAKKIIKTNDLEKEELKNWANTVKITDKIRNEWFKDYGFMNGWDKTINNKWETAVILHNRDLADHPELHTRLIEHNDPSRRGINNYISCEKCKLKASWDSSD